MKNVILQQTIKQNLKKLLGYKSENTHQKDIKKYNQLSLDLENADISLNKLQNKYQ